MPAKAKAVTDGVVHLHISARVGDIIKIQRRVGRLQVYSGRQKAIVQRQRGENTLHTAGTAQQMPGHGFGGGYGQPVGMVTEHRLDGSGLAAVIQVGGGAVGVDIPDLLGGYTAVRQCQHRRHRPARAP